MRRVPLFITMVFVSCVFFNAAPHALAALYPPGSTLDPACLPTDTNCGVSTTTSDFLAHTLAVGATGTTTISSAGALATPSLTIGSLAGFLKAIGGAVSTALVNLASDVTGTLTVVNGGTGLASVQSGAVLLGNGTGNLATTTRGDITGTGVNVSGGSSAVLGSGVALTLDTSGNWAGTLGGNSASYYLDARNQTNYGVPFYVFFHGTTTDALAEGSGHLYYTNARADARINATSTIGTLTSAPSLGTVSTALSGVLKATSGVLSAATAGVDFENPLTFSYPFTRTVNAISLAFGTTTDNTWSGANNFTSTLALGSTTPWAVLSVNPNGATGPAFVVGSSTATSFIVTNGGSVGVGTTSPASTFSVSGNVFIGGATGGNATTTSSLGVGLTTIRSGSGAPSGSNAGGSTYFETDNGEAWSFFGAQTPPTVVQSVGMNNGFTGTLGSAPTVGNYMIAGCFQDGAGGIPSTSGGWTQFASFTKVNGQMYANYVYRKVQGGDGATETPCGNLSGNRGGYLVEVSGLSSTNFNTNLQATPTSVDVGSVASASAIVNYTTTTGDTLNICMGAGSASGNFTMSGSTWINQGIVANNGRSEGGGTNFAAGNSTAVSCQTNGSPFSGGMMATLITLQPTNAQTTGWQQISYLTTLKNAGTNITSLARTLNFANGLQAYDDGSGNTSVYLATTTANTYTALQQFNGNASTTQISATRAYFGGSATTTIDSAGAINTPSITIGALSGFLKATAGSVSTSLVNLGTDVTGSVGFSNGGTGTSTFYGGGLVFSDGSKLTQANNSGNGTLYWDNTNNKLGIGTSSPWAMLSVNPNGLSAGVPQLVVGSSTNTSFIVTNSGAVGIGTSAPTGQFSVATTSIPFSVTGGTVTTSGGSTIVTFTGSGTLTATGNGTISYLVAAGGGAGGGNGGGGGGGGGVATGTMSVSRGSYSVVVGAGGTAGTSPGGSGGNSSLNGITAVGGGGGATRDTGGAPTSGGSGGGGANAINGNSAARTGASGTAGQGNTGGNGPGSDLGANGGGGGGGGAGTVGSAGGANGGNGGNGTTTSISGSPVTYGGGGGGGVTVSGTPGTGGSGGGGAGSGGTATAGTANTGGGGGGGGTGANGGSGVVIVSYTPQTSTTNLSGFTVTQTGYVGVGDTAPAAGLSVSTNATIGYASGQTAPNNGLIVSGNLGVGTTTPAATFGVQGNAYISGSATVGLTAISSGSGAPAASNSEGSLYLEAGNGQAYTMWSPPTNVPSVLQSASASGNSYSVTLGSTPTAGNYLVGYCAGTSAPAAGTGFTAVTNGAATFNNSGFIIYGQLVYRKVQGGDGTNWTLCTGSGVIGNFLYEVSNLDSANINNSIQNVTSATGGRGVSVGYTTTTGNTLSLGFGSLDNSCVVSFTSMNGSTWLSPIYSPSPNGSNFGAAAESGYLTSAANGSSVTASINATGWCSTSVTGGLIMTLQPSSPQTVGWQPLSFLTTLKNAGTSIATNARTLNFSTGLQAYDDGSGNTSVYLATTTGNTFTGLQQFQGNASTTELSVYTKAFFGGTATTTIDSAGNLLVAGSATSTNLFAGRVTAGLAAFGQTATSTFTANGSLGVGTSTPYSPLTVWGTDTSGNTAAFTISNSASTTEFQVFDNGAATLAGTLTQNSDQRLKTNVVPLDASSSLAAILALDPVTYNWIDSSLGGATQLGFVAQAVQSIFPQLVSTTSATKLTPDGTLGLNYIGLIAPMVESIKELAHEVDDLAQSLTTNVLNATTVHTKNICVGDTCITETQLKVLLQQSGQAPATVETTTPQTATSSSDTASTSPSTTSTTTPVTSTESSAPPVPDATPVSTDGSASSPQSSTSTSP